MASDPKRPKESIIAERFTRGIKPKAARRNRSIAKVRMRVTDAAQEIGRNLGLLQNPCCSGGPVRIVQRQQRPGQKAEFCRGYGADQGFTSRLRKGPGPNWGDICATETL